VEGRGCRAYSSGRRNAAAVGRCKPEIEEVDRVENGDFVVKKLIYSIIHSYLNKRIKAVGSKKSDPTTEGVRRIS
jgi:hypothetical protein